MYRRLAQVSLVLAAALLAAVVRPAQAQITGTNWTGEYYNNTDLSGDPVATTSYPNGIFANWGDGPPLEADNTTPVPGVNADNFSAVFTSTQNFAAGFYIFTFYVDDGMRFYFDDVLIIDQFNENTTGAYRTFTAYRQISAGPHTMRVEFVEFAQNAIVAVQWGMAQPLSYIYIFGPDNGVRLEGDVSPALQWQDIGIEAYKVKLKQAGGEIVLKAAFASGSVCDADGCTLDLSSPPFHPPVVLANGDYAWRVYGQGTPLASKLATFTIRYPGKPFALAPDFNLEVNTPSPVLAWAVVDAAAEYAVRLKHRKTGDVTDTGWLAAGPICGAVYCTLDLSALGTPIVLFKGTVEWRVSARNLAVAPGVVKSKTAVFKVVPAAPRSSAPVPLPAAPDGFRGL